MQIDKTHSLKYIHNVVPLQIQALYMQRYLLTMNNYPPDILQITHQKSLLG